MLIEYWSDFTCPFCYIAEARMKKVLRDLDLEKDTKIVFKAFELNPNSSSVPKRTVVEGFARHYAMPIEMAQAQVERIESMGRGEGLVFNYGTAHVTNTFDALRIAKLAQSKSNDLCNAYADRMYKAFFEENLIMADRDVIRRMAEEIGMDGEEVSRVLESGEFSDEVRQDEYEANRLGLSAVPFFAINRKYGIPGAVDARDMARMLLKAYDDEEAEAAKPGMVCGPDGCHPVDGGKE